MMHTAKKLLSFTVLATFVSIGVSKAAELPSSFPGDIPLADYMVVVNVMEVGDDMMIDLHAPGQTLASVVEWFQSGMTDEGWSSDGESISERKAILAYSKEGRTCGVSITNFVLNSSMQMDDSTKGVTLQISGADAAADDSADVSTQTTGDVAL